MPIIKLSDNGQAMQPWEQFRGHNGQSSQPDSVMSSQRIMRTGSNKVLNSVDSIISTHHGTLPIGLPYVFYRGYWKIRKGLEKNPKEKTSGKAKLSDCKDLISSFVQVTKRKKVPRCGCREVYSPLQILCNKRVFSSGKKQ